MACRRGSNEQSERLLVAAARGGPRALSGFGCGGPTARAAAAARGLSERRAAKTMVSAGSRGEWTRGSSGRRLHLWSREWAVSRGGSGVLAVPDSAWGGRARRGRQKQGAGSALHGGGPAAALRVPSLRLRAYVMPLLKIGGVLILPTRTARSVRGLPRIPRLLCNRSLFTWLRLKVPFHSEV